MPVENGFRTRNLPALFNVLFNPKQKKKPRDLRGFFVYDWYGKLV
jgi:hypothetical protein